MGGRSGRQPEEDGCGLGGDSPVRAAAGDRLRLADDRTGWRFSRHYPWFVVAVLLLTYTVSFVDRQVLGLLVEPIERDLQLSDFAFALATGFPFAVFYVVVGLAAGRIADRWNRRNLILLGLLIWVPATAGAGFVTGAVSLMIARAFLAIGEAALTPAAYSLLTDYFPPGQRARAMSFYTLGVYLGSALAFLIGGAVLGMAGSDASIAVPLLGTFKPWQATFVVVALPGVLAFGLMFLVREPQRVAHGSGDGAPAGRIGAGDESLAYFVPRLAFYVPTLLGLGAIAMVTYGFAVWLPASFLRTWGWTAGQFGAAYGTIILVFGGAGMLTAGVVADRLASRGKEQAALHTSLVAILGLFVSTVMFAFATSGALAIGAIAFATFFLGVPIALGPVIFLPVTPNRLRGQATSACTLVMTLLGLGVGPPLVGFVTDRIVQDEAALQVVLGLTTSGAAIAGFLGLLWGGSAYRRVFGLERATAYDGPAAREGTAA